MIRLKIDLYKAEPDSLRSSRSPQIDPISGFINLDTLQHVTRGQLNFFVVSLRRWPPLVAINSGVST